jgi:hypothetical protein
VVARQRPPPLPAPGALAAVSGAVPPAIAHTFTYMMCVGYKFWRSGSGPKPMAITLTAEEIGYLEQLAEAGVRGINAPTPHCGLQRLVDAGYVTDHPVSLHGVLYLITDLGRNALADAER